MMWRDFNPPLIIQNTFRYVIPTLKIQVNPKKAFSFKYKLHMNIKSFLIHSKKFK